MARLMYKAADKTMGAEKTKLEGREKKHMQTVHENKTAGEQTGDVMDVTAVVPGGLLLKSNNVIKLCYSTERKKGLEKDAWGKERIHFQVPTIVIC